MCIRDRPCTVPVLSLIPNRFSKLVRSFFLAAIVQGRHTERFICRDFAMATQSVRADRLPLSAQLVANLPAKPHQGVILMSSQPGSGKKASPGHKEVFLSLIHIFVARMGKTDPPAVKPAPAQSGSSSVASSSKPSGQRGGLYPSLYTPASSITSGSINIKQGK